MNNKKIDRIKAIIVERLGVSEEEVKLESKFIKDLGADSLDILALVIDFEGEFGIRIPNEYAEKLESVGDVLNYLSVDS